VFDYFVVVQLTNKLVYFYEKPLIMGGSMAPYKMSSLVSNMTSQLTPLVDVTLKTWDVSIS
jgi:hypothetical protein